MTDKGTVEQGGTYLLLLFFYISVRGRKLESIESGNTYYIAIACIAYIDRN
jgi:hypothetical protein